MCLGAFFERQKQRQNLGGGHPAGVVLEAGGAPGEADEPVPWTLRQGRELDSAAAPMGTLRVLICGATFLLLLNVFFFSNANYLRNSIKTNKQKNQGHGNGILSKQ